MHATAPQVGSLAPEFSVDSTTGRGNHVRRSLADYRGRWLLLVFYPRDFSLICPTELTALSTRIAEFERRGCDVLAISTDTLETHDRWIEAPKSMGGLGGLNFPLAADLAGSVCETYGVYLKLQKAALRGLFMIDPNQVLQYSVVHSTSVGRRSDEVLRILDALQSGGLCPENWQPGTAPLSPGESINAGTILGHYEFGERLGRGAFALVFKARDLQLERDVAIKVLDPNRVKAPSTILHEARSAAAINHPNLCGVYAVDDSEGVSMIVLEFIDGKSLRQLLQAGPLPLSRAASLAAQMARGMAAAHERGIVHGDLKPENVMLTRDGVVKITDFGLSRREPQPASVDSTLVLPERMERNWAGTPRYMAPEQAQGRPATRATDVYSLGLILYEMVTGKLAFEGDSLPEVLYKVSQATPEQFTKTSPPELAPLLTCLLATEPDRRGTMPDAARSLERLLTA